jgi:hypothetical protein
MAEDEKEPQNCEELQAAIAKTGENEKGRQQYLIKRSIDLGCVEHIPDDWEV